MKNLIIALVCSASLAGCSSLPSSTNELEKRALPGLDEKIPRYIPSRKSQRVETVCVSGRFLKSGDWFHQSWVSLIVESADWIFDDPMLKKIQSN